MSTKKKLKQYDLFINGEFKQRGTIAELSEVTGLDSKTLYTRVPKEIKGVRLKVAEEETYAFYDGDATPLIGTMDELVEWTGITERMLTWYSYPSSQKRHDKALIKMEDEDMRTRRTMDRHAPVLDRGDSEPKRKKKVISKSVPLRPFKFKNPWIRRQVADMFRNWGEV